MTGGYLNNTIRKETTVETLWRATPWLNRLILFPPLALFTMLATTIIRDPVRSAADHGITVDTAIGLTNYRSGNGGIFLAFAILTLACMVSARRHLTGLTFIATLMIVILVLRGISALMDGTLPAQRGLLIAETVFGTLSIAGAVLDLGRRKWLSSRPVTAAADSVPGT